MARNHTTRPSVSQQMYASVTGPSVSQQMGVVKVKLAAAEAELQEMETAHAQLEAAKHQMVAVFGGNAAFVETMEAGAVNKMSAKKIVHRAKAVKIVHRANAAKVAQARGAVKAVIAKQSTHHTAVKQHTAMQQSTHHTAVKAAVAAAAAAVIATYKSVKFDHCRCGTPLRRAPPAAAIAKYKSVNFDHCHCGAPLRRSALDV